MTENPQPVVLLVGHCMPDVFMLRNAVRSALGEVEVEGVNSDEDLERRLGAARLLLVNRSLDGRFRASSGIELIRSLLAGEGAAPAIMLISDRSEAQAEAEAAGALPGFGKSRLYDPLVRTRLRAALEARPAEEHSS